MKYMLIIQREISGIVHFIYGRHKKKNTMQ